MRFIVDSQMDTADRNVLGRTREKNRKEEKEENPSTKRDLTYAFRRKITDSENFAKTKRLIYLIIITLKNVDKITLKNIDEILKKVPENQNFNRFSFFKVKYACINAKIKSIFLISR